MNKYVVGALFVVVSGAVGYFISKCIHRKLLDHVVNSLSIATHAITAASNDLLADDNNRAKVREIVKVMAEKYFNEPNAETLLAASEEDIPYADIIESLVILDLRENVLDKCDNLSELRKNGFDTDAIISRVSLQLKYLSAEQLADLLISKMSSYKKAKKVQLRRAHGQ